MMDCQSSSPLASLKDLTTEQRNPATGNISDLPTGEILRLINEEDHKVAPAVKKVLPEVEAAVELIVAALKGGGRLFYLGAGTSGRLGIIDAAECPPTFGTDPELVQGVIAGGKAAVFRAQEDAEDHEESGATALAERGLTGADVVVGLSASGRTPFVIGGLKYAQTLGCPTIGITCNRNAELSRYVRVMIAPDVGPEVLAGSTRMKSATAQKMILTMLSTATMIRLGRVESNLLIDMQTRCYKLRDRATRVVMELTGASAAESSAALRATGGNVRAAIETIRSQIALGTDTPSPDC